MASRRGKTKRIRCLNMLERSVEHFGVRCSLLLGRRSHPSKQCGGLRWQDWHATRSRTLTELRERCNML